MRALRFLPVVLLVLVGPAGAQPLALTNVTVVDVAAGTERAGMTVLVDGGDIVAVGPAGRVAVPASAVRYDGAGGYVIPGLWDAHVHALWDAAVADAFLPRFVAYGVTGIRDMGGTLEVLHDVRRRRAAGALVAPRILAAGLVLDGLEPVDPSISVAVGSPAEARRAVDSLAAAGADVVKVYTLLPAAAFEAVVERARVHGLPVVGHVPAEVAPAEAARAGMRTVEHMRAELGGYCSRADPAPCDALFATFRRHATWQTPTLVVRHHARAYADAPDAASDPELGQLPAVVRAYWRSDQAAKLDGRTAADWARLRAEHDDERWLAGRLHAAGVPVLAGTDAGVTFVYPGRSLHEELAMLVEVGLTPAEALRAATLGPAEAFGLAASVGTVEPGKRADLVVLAASPLADIRNTRRIRAVVAGGALLDRARLDALLAAAPD